ncbi:MAG: ankyrin repeat domain-containing protein [bacterium]|nr:ankyrin repeat domain-containing protein [bacterium]
MALENKMGKIEKLIRKEKYEKAIKTFNKFPEEPNRFRMLADLMERLTEDINSNSKHATKDLYDAAKEGDLIGTIQAIMETADINAESKWGSPLLVAMFNANVRVGELLIHLGANVDAHDSSGETSLMNAAVGDNKEIVRLLIKKGANPFAKNKFQRTAKMRAKLKERKEASFITRDIIEILEIYEKMLIGQFEQAQPTGDGVAPPEGETPPEVQPAPEVQPEAPKK